jgi:D-threo-aldose 1-dehydrogenase
MQTRRFGRTGLQVSALTFGGGWVGGVLIHQDQSVAFSALDRAVAAGIDWIDTAASYGDGVSEQVIGRWLAARADKSPPQISTKFRVDPAAGDFAGQIRRSVADSFKRLGLSKVNVLILHNQMSAAGGGATLTPADILGPGGVADTLAALQAEGLCDHIGLTALGEPAAVNQVVSAGRFDVAQVYYNAINPTADWTPPAGWNSTSFEGLLKACADQDVGVMGIRIFAAGHLATTERHGREVPITANSSHPAEEARARAIWQILGSTYGTPAQAALRFGLACKALSTIEVGMAELDHLEQALAAEQAGPLPASVQTALEQVWRTDPAFVG